MVSLFQIWNRKSALHCTAQLTTLEGCLHLLITIYGKTILIPSDNLFVDVTLRRKIRHAVSKKFCSWMACIGVQDIVAVNQSWCYWNSWFLIFDKMCVAISMCVKACLCFSNLITVYCSPDIVWFSLELEKPPSIEDRGQTDCVDLSSLPVTLTFICSWAVLVVMTHTHKNSSSEVSQFKR